MVIKVIAASSMQRLTWGRAGVQRADEPLCLWCFPERCNMSSAAAMADSRQRCRWRQVNRFWWTSRRKRGKKLSSRCPSSRRPSHFAEWNHRCRRSPRRSRRTSSSGRVQSTWTLSCERVNECHSGLYGSSSSYKIILHSVSKMQGKTRSSEAASLNMMDVIIDRQMILLNNSPSAAEKLQCRHLCRVSRAVLCSGTAFKNTQSNLQAKICE